MIQTDPNSVGEPQILSLITKPLTNFIIQIKKDVAANNSMANSTLIKHYCPKNVTKFLKNGSNVAILDEQRKCENFLI